MRKRTRNRMIAGLIAAICVSGIIACLFILLNLRNRGAENPQETQTTFNQKKSDKKESDSSIRERVSAYRKQHPELSKEQATLEVKMNLDHEPYTHIQEVPDPNAIDLLVNKYYQLPDGYEPTDLITVSSSGENGNVQMRQEAGQAFEALIDAAEKEGIALTACSAYRSYSYQENLFNNGKAQGGQEYADMWWTRPGHSEHQTGLSVDIRLDGNTSDLDAPRYSENYPWLLEHMHEYGFILRYPDDKKEYTLIEPESWHLRYVGVEDATAVYNEKLCWEEYVAMKP